MLPRPLPSGWTICSGSDSIAGRLCFYFVAIGEYNRALAAGQRALALAVSSGAVDVQLYVQANLGLAYSAVGDFRQTLDVSLQMMAWLTGERRYARAGQVGPLLGVISRGHVAWSLAEMGDFAEGTGVGEEAVQLAEAVGHPYSVAIALMWVGVLYCRQGALHQANDLVASPSRGSAGAGGMTRRDSTG
jgi:hypothetical protein